jgi:opacity protein-like surface antigen
MRHFRGILLGGVGCFAIASAVVAADLDLPPAPQTFSNGPRWDGPYIGVNAGWGTSPGNDASTTWFKSWPSTDPTFAALPANAPPNSALRFSPSGFAGGAQVGFNKQFGSLVFGVESDYDYVGARSKASMSGVYSGATIGGTPFSGGYTISQSQQLNSLGTFRAKLGFTPMDDLLLYATGGLAFGQTSATSAASIPNTGGVLPNDSAFQGTRENWAVGYAIGGGVEYALDRNWSVRAEAIYYDLGHSSVVGVANLVGQTIQTDTDTTYKGYMLRLGLNYEFDGQDSASYQDAPDRLSDAAQDLKVTVGERVGFSTSNARMTLYDATGQTMVSRLTYHDPSSTTGEVYARIDDSSGVFMKGYVGMGTESGGHLQDEDFPPGITPYSSTNSPQRYGHLEYFSADAGYYAYSDSQYKLGGLAGWHYLDEAFNAYGCTQTASNAEVCPPGIVGGNNLTISDEGHWNSIRLGIVGEAKLGAGFSVRGEAVWLPFSYFTASNDHWLRMPTDFQGAIPESGVGHTGYQLEGELNYALTRNFDIGVGARFWSLNATGKTDFNEANPFGGKQVATFETQRFQAFAQTSYKF